MYTSLNQYHVVMEVAPQFWQDPQGSTTFTFTPAPAGGSAQRGGPFRKKNRSAGREPRRAVPGRDDFFQSGPGVALSDAVQAISQAEQKIGMPASIRSMYSGSMQAFQDSLSTEPFLIVYGPAGGLYRAGNAL
jgi:multidrug efflux pump